MNCGPLHCSDPRKRAHHHPGTVYRRARRWTGQWQQRVYRKTERVAIARALIHSPALVLADEPTASLDTERAHQVVQTFANLIHEQARAGIMVTHDQRMTVYADRVIRMMDGTIERVLDHPDEIRAFSRGGGIAAPLGELPAPGAAPALAGDGQGR